MFVHCYDIGPHCAVCNPHHFRVMISYSLSLYRALVDYNIKITLFSLQSQEFLRSQTTATMHVYPTDWRMKIYDNGSFQ